MRKIIRIILIVLHIFIWMCSFYLLLLPNENISFAILHPISKVDFKFFSSLGCKHLETQIKATWNWKKTTITQKQKNTQLGIYLYINKTSFQKSEKKPQGLDKV